MNEAAFAAMHPASGQTADFRGELDGEAFSARLVCTEHLPQAEPFAVLAVSAAELHDTETLRICAADQNAFSPSLFGLTVTNPEAQCAAEYEQEMLLLRIRFGVLSAVLALLGAAAFFRLHNRKIEKYKTICAGSQSAENTLPIGS
jgi:hypothetical protein